MALRNSVQEQTERPHPAATKAFLEAVHRRWPQGVCAVIFYGSCRRSARPEGLYDLYVVLDDTRDLPRLERILLSLLPPNVYYLEAPDPASDDILRSKTTVVTLGRFMRGMGWFHSYLWARFCQPVTLVYCRDERIRESLLQALESAVRTFIRRALPLLEERFSSATLWVTGLRASYRAELRTEGSDRAKVIFEHDPDYYTAITTALCGLLDYTSTGEVNTYTSTLTPLHKALGRLAWTLRFGLGKLLSVARILKSWATFEGGLDYIVWKLERHSGHSITIPERVRRRPLVYLWPFFWGLYKQGIFR